MINSINLKNFKCYQEVNFNFSNMSVFCGSNSSGKSTAIQSILLFMQNLHDKNLDMDLVSFMGKYFSFGTLEDVQCHNPQGKDIEVTINQSSIIIDVQKNFLNQYEATLEESIDLTSEDSIFDDDFIYLSADRYGPRNSSEIKLTTNEFNVGIYGEYAFAEYDRLERTNVANTSLAKAITGLEEGEMKLNVIIAKVMNTICPGFSVNTKNIKGVDQVSANFSKDPNKNIRPTNVGFGFSCLFPIVLSAICIKPGGTLIIENPEVHLHPRAQSELAQFLALVSDHGIQVIIETHSDHIVNGLRVYAKKHSSFEGKAIINSIHNVPEESQPRKMEISIDKHGRFSQIEEGFFDQIQKDLMELF